MLITASYKTQNGNSETETKRTEHETTSKTLILLTVLYAALDLTVASSVKRHKG